MRFNPRQSVLAAMALGVVAMGGLSCDYPFDCRTEMPETGTLTVRLTVNNENPSVPITVYYGDIERRDVAISDIVSESIVSYDAPVNETYTVTAWYVVDQDTVVVIDSDDITVDLDEEKSSEYYDCWKEVDHAKVDVRLKIDSLPDTDQPGKPSRENESGIIK